MSTTNTTLMYATAFLAVFAEASFPGFRIWLGAQPDLLPALMVYAALRSSLLNVALLAVFGGLCFDSLSADPLGVSILPLYLVGAFISLKRDLILRDLSFAQVVLGAAASAAVPLLKLLLLLSHGRPLLLDWGSLWQLIVMTVCGAAATPLLFGLFHWFNHAFGYKLRTETSFRLDREIRRSRL